MKGIAVVDFKHGKMAFAKSQIYEVPDIYMGFFAGVGWMAPYGGSEAGTAVTMEMLGVDAPKEAVVVPEGGTLQINDAVIPAENFHAGVEAAAGGDILKAVADAAAQPKE
jgi:hypothetical protein